jgi:hypothetical protein
MKPPYAARHIFSSEELTFYRGDRQMLKAKARENLLRKVGQAVDVNDYVLMFSEQIINDEDSPHYRYTYMNLLAYPKENFNGGAFAHAIN